jgi:hypothetical protein
MTQPMIRRLYLDPPPLPESAADTGFAWFTPGRSTPAVPVALPPDAALLARGRVTLALVLEVLAGRRRIDQISSLISAPVARYLAAHRDLATGPKQVRLHSVRLCQPHEHAGEFAAVYYVGPRAHALAARLERTGSPAGRERAPRPGAGGAPIWTLTALRLG